MGSKMQSRGKRRNYYFFKIEKNGCVVSDNIIKLSHIKHLGVLGFACLRLFFIELEE